MHRWICWKRKEPFQPWREVSSGTARIIIMHAKIISSLVITDISYPHRRFAAWCQRITICRGRSCLSSTVWKKAPLHFTCKRCKNHWSDVGRKCNKNKKYCGKSGVFTLNWKEYGVDSGWLYLQPKLLLRALSSLRLRRSYIGEKGVSLKRSQGNKEWAVTPKYLRVKLNLRLRPVTLRRHRLTLQRQNFHQAALCILENAFSGLSCWYCLQSNRKLSEKSVCLLVMKWNAYETVIIKRRQFAFFPSGAFSFFLFRSSHVCIRISPTDIHTLQRVYYSPSKNCLNL